MPVTLVRSRFIPFVDSNFTSRASSSVFAVMSEAVPDFVLLNIGVSITSFLLSAAIVSAKLMSPAKSISSAIVSCNPAFPIIVSALIASVVPPAEPVTSSLKVIVCAVSDKVLFIVTGPFNSREVADTESRTRSELIREALRTYIHKSRVKESAVANKNAAILEALLD